jgi:hypothetical protein
VKPAKKSFVTSAGQANSYVVSALAPQGTGPTDSTLYLIPSGARGLSVAGAWDGLGLRANASAPMTLDDCEASYQSQLTDDGAGFQAMLQVVLPLFKFGSAAVALGICRAAVAGTATHLKSARFEHLGQSLGESLPTLRAQIATMQIDTDGLAARIDDLIDHLERPRDTTVLRVLESKAAAGDTAIAVTSAAMRICGGAAFAKHMAVERLFRDAHAGAVMAPTGDVLPEIHRQGGVGDAVVLGVEISAPLRQGSARKATMSRTIWVGAVAYDPKVVTIWEGMRRYLHEEARLPVEVVLFQSYEMQVAALLAAPTDPTPRIDIAWNTNLAYLQADSWSNHRCRPIAMRDTRLDDHNRCGKRRAGFQAVRSQKSYAFAWQPRQRPCRDFTSLFFGTRRHPRGTGLSGATLRQRCRQTRGHRRERGRGRSRGARRPRRRRRDRQPLLENATRRATGARGCTDGNLEVAAVQSLHVHVTSQS